MAQNVPHLDTGDIRITHHAIDRYWQRACPDATRKQVERQLRSMVACARFDGSAMGGAWRYMWGDVVLVVKDNVLITLYWKHIRVKEREKVTPKYYRYKNRKHRKGRR